MYSIHVGYIDCGVTAPDGVDGGDAADRGALHARAARESLLHPAQPVRGRDASLPALAHAGSTETLQGEA